LSLPAKRGSGLSPRGIVKCCHTYPNERLLQRQVFHNSHQKLFVVIPTQTIGFYNSQYLELKKLDEVVIPTQTIGFYNKAKSPIEIKK